jgi:ABC-2 type transport system permease protein
VSNLANVVTIARREFTVRLRTRTFLIGTIALVIGVAAIAFVPVIVRYADQSSSQRVAVWTEPGALTSDPAATISVLLNAATGASASITGSKPGFVVTPVPDLAAAREAAGRGEVSAVLGIRRAADGALTFTLYTSDPSTSRVSQLLAQVSTTVAIGDRLDRLGIAPAERATLFAPAAYAVEWLDPARAGPVRGSVEEGTSYLLGFGMTILIFMMIVLYGNWVAMSVVEEKSSRVMEVILNAATPFQLLTGKVLGVGGVALVQYAAILAAGIAAMTAQGPVASLILGEQAGNVSLPAGLTIGVLGILVVYGVLGFLLYAVLYAAAGSLVSRQEDVSAAVMPMALVSTAGYLIAIYAATGLFDIRSGWVTVLSQVPFVSPFLMLSRVTAGEAAPLEVVLSIVILVVSIFVCLRIAARIYAAGVLLYGQRPSIRAVWRLIREPG